MSLVSLIKQKRKASHGKYHMNKMIMTIMCIAAVITPLASAVTPLPEKVSCAIADRQDFQIPDRVQLAGWLGSRIEANEKNRLVKIDPARLL